MRVLLYLNARLGEVKFERQRLSHEDVRVVAVAERVLELLQLPRREVGSRSASLLRRVVSVTTRTRLVCTIHPPSQRLPAAADRSARRAASRPSCCTQRWTLSVINWRLTTVASLSHYKGRPGSGTTKLDSGAQKRLRRSRIEDYEPRPQARTRLARAEVSQRASVRADRRPLRSTALVARTDFLKIGHFAPFSQFLHIKGLHFPDVFIRSRLPMTPVNHEKFHGNRSARF